MQHILRPIVSLAFAGALEGSGLGFGLGGGGGGGASGLSPFCSAAGTFFASALGFSSAGLSSAGASAAGAASAPCSTTHTGCPTCRTARPLSLALPFTRRART